MMFFIPTLTSSSSSSPSSSPTSSPSPTPSGSPTSSPSPDGNTSLAALTIGISMIIFACILIYILFLNIRRCRHRRGRVMLEEDIEAEGVNRRHVGRFRRYMNSFMAAGAAEGAQDQSPDGSGSGSGSEEEGQQSAETETEGANGDGGEQEQEQGQEWESNDGSDDGGASDGTDLRYGNGRRYDHGHYHDSLWVLVNVNIHSPTDWRQRIAVLDEVERARMRERELSGEAHSPGDFWL
ncbi:hypothetical protein SBOR_9019 [Sclerotinia borealis F-4128]|uniref:Uncharacterized protein n=1 Tax=Sclerotinia borealis (strain F-4128) TaxID=1432307 RepID=W9C7N8_SCLBF|nr:hypothetical protein SBOR_9019 [Sclerotinia borealis F-4128]